MSPRPGWPFASALGRQPIEQHAHSDGGGVQGGAYVAPTTPSSNPQNTGQSLGDGCLPRVFVRGIGRWDDRSREQNAFWLDLRPASALATALAVAVAEGPSPATFSPALVLGSRTVRFTC
ncbi:MAG TPA: hypothetical protein VFI46_14590 [Jiangellaceae bacterium]|nr:hypothetical protein [Jiangellaceae bacterium]